MDISGISVVIPAYNEEKFLPETLESIRLAREYFYREFSKPIEVIVVNNGSTDGTVEVATRLEARTIDHLERNIAAVRNAGIRAAQFDLVVTVDADNFVPQNAFAEIWRAMQTGRYVGGGVRVSLDGNRTVHRILLFVVERALFYFAGISLGMFFFWKYAAERVRGFPEEYLVGEDTAFALALKKFGRNQGLKYSHLNSVRLVTRDRKRVSIFYALKNLWHAVRLAIGRKVTREQLSYWYNPNR